MKRLSGNNYKRTKYIIAVVNFSAKNLSREYPNLKTHSTTTKKTKNINKYLLKM